MIVGEWARRMKRQTHTLYFAVRDSRTPWQAKFVAGAVVAYALSPIDLIPDFIPVLGYLDDLIIVPAGLWIALRMIPAEVIRDAQARAALASERPTSIKAAAVIVGLWLIALGLGLWWALKQFSS